MPPGPEVARQTPSLPVYLAYAHAMNAADSSWRTWIKRTFSWRTRRASMMPLMPSPGRPKTVSTPQSIRVSMSMSDAFILCLSQRVGCEGGSRGLRQGGLSLLLEVLMLRRVGEELRANQSADDQGHHESPGPFVVDGEMRNRLIDEECQRPGSQECTDETSVPSELDGEPDNDHQKNQRQDRWRVRASSPEQHGNADRSKAYGRTDQLANARR